MRLHDRTQEEMRHLWSWALTGQQAWMGGAVGPTQLLIVSSARFVWVSCPGFSCTKPYTIHTRRTTEYITPELFPRIISGHISTIWDVGPMGRDKYSSGGWIPRQIFRIGVLILSHYHWQAAAFSPFKSRAKIQFPEFYEKKWKNILGVGERRVAQERFGTSKTLKNLLMN